MRIVLSVIVAGALILLAIVTKNNTVDGTAKNLESSVVEFRKSIEKMSVVQFKEKISSGEVVVIDVRTSEEYESGFIEGALNLNFYEPGFESELDKLDKSKSYAVYCRTGDRSGKALQIMKGHGFKNVIDLEGGIAAWLDAGLAVECPA